MSKNKFSLPVILYSGGGMGDGGDGDDTGIGSAIGHLPGDNGGNKIPVVCSFDSWLENFAQDSDKDGTIGFNDYGQWWADSGLSKEEWSRINASTPFTWEARKK